MKKNFLTLFIPIFIFSFGFSLNSSAQENSFQSLPTPKTSISGEVVKSRNAYRPNRNGKTYIENNRKKKKIKTKIRILHSDSCPSFAAYSSRPKERRERMLRRKRKS